MGRSIRREVSVSLVVGRRLALDEAAGELAGGVGPLAVLDLEREEVAAGDGVALDGGDQDDGVAVADDDGPVGLLGELAGFEDEGTVAEWTFDASWIDRHGCDPFR